MNPRGQRGLTLTDVLLALVTGAMMVGLVGFLFLRQSRNYQDLQAQARLQAQVKKAQQMMTREIANAGAGLPPGTHFTMNPQELVFSYLDLKGKHCPADSKVTLEFRIAVLPKGKALVRDRRCNGGAATRESMVVCDDAKLEFAYLKAGGDPAPDAAQTRMIEYRLEIASAGSKGYFNRTRTSAVQVWLGAN